jgi:hypothetical protein
MTWDPVTSATNQTGEEIYVLLGYYTASCDNCLPTFRDNVSVPYKRVFSPWTS